jgi:hypothetical protein
MFPRVIGRNLDGRELVFPDDFAGDVTCAIVAFRQQHQQLVDTWLPHLAQRAEQHPQLSYYELPAIGKRWVIARSFIDGGMARAITDQGTRERTVTVYGYVAQLVEGLELAGTDTIAIVLVARGGAILWQSTGSFTSDAAAELDAALDQHLAELA